jgi:HMG (high mobility group) box
MVSQAWRDLSPDSKQKYYDVAQQDKERYEAEKADYSGPWKVRVKTPAELRKEGAPKQPSSAFLSYMNDVRPTVSKQHPELCGDDLTRAIAAQWKAESTEIRQQYLDDATRRREEYNESMTKWLLENGVAVDDGAWGELEAAASAAAPAEERDHGVDSHSDDTGDSYNKKRAKRKGRQRSQSSTDTTHKSADLPDHHGSPKDRKRKAAPSTRKSGEHREMAKQARHLKPAPQHFSSHEPISFVAAMPLGSHTSSASLERPGHGLFGGDILDRSLYDYHRSVFAQQSNTAMQAPSVGSSQQDHRAMQPRNLTYELNEQFYRPRPAPGDDDLASMDSIDLPLTGDTSPPGDDFQW